jgi:hypothetical protein
MRVIDLQLIRNAKRAWSRCAAWPPPRRWSGPAGRQSYEVRRILKAFIDGQWLAAFDERLAEYSGLLAGEATGEDSFAILNRLRSRLRTYAPSLWTARPSSPTSLSG